nr:hypothetical protein [uncultured Prevotella sp.]
MKNYIKPEAEVYKVRIESLLTVSGEDGQIDSGLAKKHDYSFFDEEDNDSQTDKGSLWDYDWNNMR